MEKIYTIAPKLYHPQITLNFQNACFDIEGESFLLNAEDFYEPVIKKIQFFLSSLAYEQLVNCFFKLSFYDSKTFKVYYRLFDMLQESDNKVVVYWKFDNQDQISYENALALPQDFPQLDFVFF